MPLVGRSAPPRNLPPQTPERSALEGPAAGLPHPRELLLRRGRMPKASDAAVAAVLRPARLLGAGVRSGDGVAPQGPVGPPHGVSDPRFLPKDVGHVTAGGPFFGIAGVVQSDPSLWRLK